MKLSYVALIGASLIVAGCSRSQVVRDVASASQPIAASLRASGPSLQRNLAIQMRGFDERNARLAEQAASFGDPARRLEREWRFDSAATDKARLERLQRLREGDAELLRDPLAAVAPVEIARTPENRVDLTGLDKVVSGLERFKTRERMDWSELIAFGQSVGEELEKIEAESAVSASEPESQ